MHLNLCKILILEKKQAIIKYCHSHISTCYQVLFLSCLLCSGPIRSTECCISYHLLMGTICPKLLVLFFLTLYAVWLSQISFEISVNSNKKRDLKKESGFCALQRCNSAEIPFLKQTHSCGSKFLLLAVLPEKHTNWEISVSNYKLEWFWLIHAAIHRLSTDVHSLVNGSWLKSWVQ